MTSLSNKRWGEKKVLPLSSLLDFNKNGWFEVSEYDGNVEVYLKNIELHHLGKPLLICFNAAVPNREKREYPFFSGIKLSQDFGLPLIAIADPSLRILNKLNLSWYAGNKRQLQLQKSIADFIGKVSSCSQLPPVLIGGSGGGFAALVAKALSPKVNCHVVVWNPQVSITDYYQSFVKRYFKVCFPDAVSLEKEQQINFFEDKGIIHRVQLNDFSDLGRIVYFQNKTDSMHLNMHCLNFYKGVSLDGFYDGSYKSFYKRNIELIIGDWGHGHISPPIEKIVSSIFSLYLE